MEQKIIRFLKKPTTVRSVYFIGCIILAFCAGVYTQFSVSEGNNLPIIQIPEQPLPIAYRYKNPGIANIYDIIPAEEQPFPSENQQLEKNTNNSLESNILQEQGIQAQDLSKNKSALVASKTGTKYYQQSCGSVSRIKPENLVYFATEAEAIAKGYERTTACKWE